METVVACCLLLEEVRVGRKRVAVAITTKLKLICGSAAAGVE